MAQKAEVTRERAKLPRDGEFTKRRVLLTAERLFANEGYDGASIRDITSEVGVEVGLVNYHFGNKENLFREVLLLRARQINEHRQRLLDRVVIREYDEACLREILNAFLLPITGATKSGSRKLANYRRLIAIVVNSKIWQESIFAAHYDWITQKLVDTLRRALPRAKPAALYWTVSLFLGSMAKTVAQLGELEALSGGVCRSNDLVRIRAELVEFNIGALLAIARPD